MTARVALALAFLLPPLWLRLLFARDEDGAFELVRGCARNVLRVGGCRVRVDHVDQVPGDTPVMFVSNHVSLADAAVLLATLPYDCRFVANHVYARYPLLGAAIRAASANIVDRSSWRSRADSGQAMVDALERGRSLLVFPEGTTAHDGTMLPFRNGAFRAAAKTGAPIVPIALRGTRDMLPPGSLWVNDVEVRVELLSPIVANEAGRAGVTDLRERAAAAIRDRLATSP
jgi:1-acyl-sn-glycerol-3-phosphate acyltransferase